MFQFPCNETSLQLWLEALNLKEKPSRGRKVCYRHFQYSDITVSSENGKHYLKKGAIPSISIVTSPDEEDVDSIKEEADEDEEEISEHEDEDESNKNDEIDANEKVPLMLLLILEGETSCGSVVVTFWLFIINLLFGFLV